ncbi:MAG: hypothetical protein JNK14_14445 [Chitinophagaceae bacterium]|nr:hypothetical protein [Chitinophagaceae bacterium]
MRIPLIPACFIFCMLIQACSSGPGTTALPGAPVSVKAVQDEVKGKRYKAEKAGTHSPFKDDKTIEWLEPKAEDKFEKGIADDSKTLQLEFFNDTSVTVNYKSKSYTGTYVVDEVTGEEERPGIKLRVSYIDEEFKLGDGPATKVTYTYIVDGLNDKSLLLETPRSMNNRKIVVLMNKQ